MQERQAGIELWCCFLYGGSRIIFVCWFWSLITGGWRDSAVYGGDISDLSSFYFRVCACRWVSLTARMLLQGRFVEMPTKAIVSVSNAVPIVEGIYMIDYAWASAAVQYFSCPCFSLVSRTAKCASGCVICSCGHCTKLALEDRKRSGHVVACMASVMCGRNLQQHLGRRRCYRAVEMPSIDWVSDSLHSLKINEKYWSTPAAKNSVINHEATLKWQSQTKSKHSSSLFWSCSHPPTRPQTTPYTPITAPTYWSNTHLPCCWYILSARVIFLRLVSTATSTSSLKHCYGFVIVNMVRHNIINMPWDEAGNWFPTREQNACGRRCSWRREPLVCKLL